MFELHKLRSSGKSRKRIGRGGARGGTSGRGHKGQRARSGGKIARGFEGGQMPLHRRLPKHGFNNADFEKIIAIVNLETLNTHFNDGDEVNLESLVKAGLLKLRLSAPQMKKKRLLVKILGNGTLQKKLMITVHAYSEAARSAILKIGGQANLAKEM